MQPVMATWQAEQHAHHIAVINAQMTTHRLAAQVFFRFAPLISLLLTPELKALLGVTSTADAALFANRGLHVREGHQKEEHEILSALPKGKADLTYVGRNDPRGRKFELVFTHKDGKHLFMPMKFVPATGSRSGRDECWIETAFLIDDHGLQMKIRSKKLALVQ
jgi:hypothetical protein